MAQINSVAALAFDGEIATLTLDSPPVNALSALVREGIKRGVEMACADPDIRALVLVCAGKTFIAGADVTEFDKLPVLPALADVLATIESAKIPVIAALHGTALGGGLEVALAAHYRVAAPGAKLGLPEIKLGLIPGGGGTQRLPRLVGVEKALDMILTAAPISAQEALACGAVDALAGDGPLATEAQNFARKLIARGAPLRRLRDEKIEAADEIFAQARRNHARKNRGQIAWEKGIEAVQAAVDMPFDAGLAREREIFLGLKSGAQSQALRYVFAAERQVGKIPGLAPDSPTRPVEKIGIIGAGTMGGGIAMNFLNAGLSVTIVETKPDALERGVLTIRRTYQSSAEKGKLTQEQVEARMARLTGALDLVALAEADLVIEAVFEDMEVKRRLFRDLDRIVTKGAILATNTSYLDVNAIAAETARPQDVIGLHFFSPAHIMRLLEIVRAARTAPDVLATAVQLAKQVGKIGVVVGVCHGFVGNRILSARQREAARLLTDGALPWDVDRVLSDFGFPMGPFAMSDLAGVDIGWLAATSSSSTIKEILCEQGRKGQKTGAGYYDYDAARKATPSPVVEQIVRDFSARQGVIRRAISDQEILERCLYPMINEGAKIVAEGVAPRASDIDVVWLNGYGWPAWRGGPMYYADTVGVSHIVAKLEEFERQCGPDFRPAPLLREMAASGAQFTSGRAA